MDVAEGRCRRLIVALPPRHGKSELSAIKFPAYYLGRWPHRRVILASHTATLAARFSMRARNDFAHFAPEVWNMAVNPAVSAQYRWDVLVEGKSAGEPPGGVIAAGTGGPITGHGAHLAVIDDPVKGAEDAHSATQRDAIWDWYRYVLRTRLMPDAAVVLVCTRWHEDDLAGRLLATAAEMPQADQWDVVRLPAMAEGEDDPLGRAVGDPLWPEQYDAEALEAIRASVGSYVWAALYQQRPSPETGGVFQRGWWRHYRRPPSRFDELIQSWDMAFKGQRTSDYVVGQVWGRVGADKYLLDQVRGRLDFPATVQAVLDLSEKWPQAVTKLVEDKANGPAVIATLSRHLEGLVPVEPDGGKEARAQAVSPQVEAGNIHLPDPSIASWVGDLVEEATTFPRGAHDDQVDAMTQALLRLSQRSRAHDPSALSILRQARVYA